MDEGGRDWGSGEREVERKGGERGKVERERLTYFEQQGSGSHLVPP